MHFQKHIITLEDPIEFSHKDKNCIINQREIGIDAKSFESGMRGALRQDPDIIFVGEIRDVATMESALYASDTGHLVFGTVHASTPQQVVKRLLDYFPENEHKGKLAQISANLRAVISQKLIPSIDRGRVPIVEILIPDKTAENFILEGKFEKLSHVIELNKNLGCKSFNEDLCRLVKNGIVARKDALAYSPKPKDLDMRLKGITLSRSGVF